MINIFLLLTSFAFSREDVLIGQIFQASTQKPVSKEFLIDRMLDTDVIYLGEKHDNAIHHEIQLEIINALIEKGKNPVIGFEFFSQHQTSDLMAYISGLKSPFHNQELDPNEEEKKLRKKLGWEEREDDEWNFYFSFIKLAKVNGLSCVGTDLPSALVTRISRNGLDQLSAVELKQIPTTHLNNPAYKKLMVKKFKDSHCGWVPEDNFENLYQTWLARNDAMANAVVQTINSEKTNLLVMIVGGGHVEHNMGVYERVKYLMPYIKQVNIGLTEIAINNAPLKDYLAITKIGYYSFLPEHDYFWFSQRADYDDPCEGFKF